MKKFVSMHIFVLGASLLSVTGLSAQYFKDGISWKEATKSSAPVSLSKTAADTPTVSETRLVDEKTYNRFMKSFPAARDIHFRTSKEGTHVSFKENESNMRALYSKRGKLMYVTAAYDPSALAEDVVEDVQQAFPGYTIFGVVVDVTVGNKSARLIMIENKKNWKRIRIVDGGIDVYEEYEKI